MLDALDTKQVSAVELLQLHLERIARHNPALNAIVVPDFERARAQAEAADAARSRGGRGALLGLPMTLKESINVKGLRTTLGVPDFAPFVSEPDAPATTRARAPAPGPLGKTNPPPTPPPSPPTHSPS